MKKIATILTVFNRREKTLSCLRHLYEALEAYNQTEEENIALSVFMTDDGCTDGTADAVRSTFPDKDIHILQGTGSLFWAGGMRLAWQTAIDSGTQWTYFLLLNDDTNIYNNVFEELFEADEYGFQQTGKHGLSSGITCQPGKPEEITYGGMNFTSLAKGRHVLISPTGIPQPIDLVHANILLIHKSVCDICGILFEGYKHACADFDYGIMAKRAKFFVLSSPHVCGECEYNHTSKCEDIEVLCKMSLTDRKIYTKTPPHSDQDYLLFVRRNIPFRYPFALLTKKIRLYFPSSYKLILRFRGLL